MVALPNSQPVIAGVRAPVRSNSTLNCRISQGIAPPLSFRCKPGYSSSGITQSACSFADFLPSRFPRPRHRSLTLSNPSRTSSRMVAPAGDSPVVCWCLRSFLHSCRAWAKSRWRCLRVRRCRWRKSLARRRALFSSRSRDSASLVMPNGKHSLVTRKCITCTG